MKLTIYCIVFVVIVLFSSCGDNSPGCPFCTDELAAESVLPIGTEALIIEMKWNALREAPSIVDPSLVCENTFQEVLLRRHIRAGSCIWTPQCKIVLGTVFGSTSNYGLFADADVSVGEPGDVVVGNSNPFSPEMDDLSNLADTHWGHQESGLTAISIRSFVWPDGNKSGVNGVGFSNNGIRPLLFIVDPQFLGSDANNFEDQSTENTLAHEIGHALGLCHVDDNLCDQIGNDNPQNNLMLINGSEDFKLLTATQCNLARTNYPSVFSANVVSERLIGSITDEKDRADVFGTEGATDLYKVLFREKTDSKNLNILVGTNGLLKNIDNVTYSLVFDIDNDTNTGTSANNFFSESTQQGVELMIEITINKGILEANISKDGTLVMRSTELPKNKLSITNNTININTFTDEGCMSKPIFDEIELEISGELLASLGVSSENKALFSQNPKVQVFSSVKRGGERTIVDQCPSTPRLLKMMDPIIKKQLK